MDLLFGLWFGLWAVLCLEVVLVNLCNGIFDSKMVKSDYFCQFV